MLHVLADRNLYQLERYMPESLKLDLFDPSEGLPKDAAHADALLIRTVSQINANTLPLQKNRLKFIGTGSAGTDHVDVNYLAENGVRFASAAGCNARAVAEYVCTALLIWSETRNVALETVSVGIVGVGHVGGELCKLLKRLGVSTICYDPPRADREPAFTSSTLREVISADILSFHTPLNRTGKWPTHHWLDAQKLQNQPFKLVINAARGGVIDEKTLLEAHSTGQVEDFVLDVWEDEPAFHDASARSAWIATPHIAGYSKQAKQRATWMICKALAEQFDLEMPQQPTNGIVQFNEPPSSHHDSFAGVLKRIHPICQYDKNIRELIGLDPDTKAHRFARLRTERPFRDEYGWLEFSDSWFKTYPLLEKLGAGRISS